MGKSSFGLALVLGALACTGTTSLGRSQDDVSGADDGGGTAGASGSGSGGSGNSGTGGSTCPNPNAANVMYVSHDPAECALIDFGCRSGQTLFSNECGCGCIEPVAPLPCLIQKSPSNELIIDDCYKACQTDADCILVETRCDHCCGRAAITADLEPEFHQAATLVCADYRGPFCDCLPPPVEPRCIESRCAAFDASAR